MRYEEFIKVVRDGVESRLEEGLTVRVTKVLKNNDVEMDAISVVDESTHISPIIYLNPYYDEYMNGMEINSIVNDIYGLYEKHKKDLKFETEIFRNFDVVKDKIAFKLINTAANKKLLRDVPNISFLDLSVVFYFIFDNEYMGSATALIHNVHMVMWGITKEELYEIAKKNTPEILKCDIRNMNDLIEEIILDDIKNMVCEENGAYKAACDEEMANEVKDNLMKDIRAQKDKIAMYVLTNRQRLNGAASLLYDGIVRDFANQVESDLYIIPSSVHEVILIPALKGMEGDDFNEMIREVNENELDQVDVLSSHTYYYSREKDEIMIEE